MKAPSVLKTYLLVFVLIGYASYDEFSFLAAFLLAVAKLLVLTFGRMLHLIKSVLLLLLIPACRANSMNGEEVMATVVAALFTLTKENGA